MIFYNDNLKFFIKLCHLRFELGQSKLDLTTLCCPCEKSFRSLAIHRASKADSDQTACMHRLIRIFIRCACHLVGFDGPCLFILRQRDTDNNIQWQQMQYLTYCIKLRRHGIKLVLF